MTDIYKELVEFKREVQYDRVWYDTFVDILFANRVKYQTDEDIRKTIEQSKGRALCKQYEIRP